MSQEYMDPELLSDFFNEAKEHLETIEPNLLQLEANPEDLGLLNDIFRPMHSLKGASGFLGLNKINRLAHKAENILDDLRQGLRPVTSAVMDVILSATDALRTMVDNLEASGAEGDVEVQEIISRIEVLQHSKPEADTAAAAPAPQGNPAKEPAPAQPAPAQPAPAPKANGVRIQIATDPDFDDTPYALTTVGEGHLTDFLEEAQDIIEDLNRSLVTLEGGADDSGGLINDIFRYFHNLKGNSGIIGFKELNALTHEAETLLNRVRKGEMQPSQPLFDLLLAVVDLIEAMIAHVEPSTGEVTPMDSSGMVELLQRSYEEGVIPEIAMHGDVQEEQPAPQAAEPEPPQPPMAPAPQEMTTGADDEVLEAGGFDPEDVAIFENAVGQQIDNLNLALGELARDASQEKYVDGIYRALLTIQNSCGYMGLDEIRDYAAQTAGLVDQGRKSGDFGVLLDILGQEVGIISDRLLGAVDKLKSGMDAPEEILPVETPASRPAKPAPAPAAPAAKAAPPAAASPVSRPSAPAPAPPASPAPAAPVPAMSAKSANASAKQKTASTIRVDHQKLDHLMNLIGELIINRNRYALLARALEEGQEEVHVVAQQLTETTYAMARISDDLQDTIMNVRMVPVQTVFSRFPRLVRDLSRKSGKQIELITEGEETELDKSVVEEIGDPLVHLVRNAVDHGLESEEDRVAAGKSPTGHVWLRAYHKGNSVAIEVEDDGRGIDPEKMRNVAVKKGVLTVEEAANLDDREAIDLIFHPGFSSAEKVTDISGRGVGMDVVKTNIKNLKGSVHTQSEVGKGTKLTLTLPLTLAIIDALMVEVAGDIFAIPLDAVSETTKIKAEKLSDVNSRKAVTLRGEVLGIVELSELLDLPTNTESRTILPIVIVHDNDRRVGLVVDRLLERQEIVIKPLGQYLSDFDLDGISGATIMGDGSVVLILDPHEIYALATSLGRPQARGLDRPKAPALGAARGAAAQALEAGR
ncbi:chemotaxis protein CheA [Paucidesulfovibrio longus]|uniref:chemotaxis protein CheA n=1 Tax=Paucidesulfovibrio longus TaxID=889 RepID=UPI0003B63806|nr:chemotaxis protein CheA [Paucidesulfovibrio longus]